MYSEFDKRIMLKFLGRNYPVSRVKHNSRFRRAIILDSGSTYILGDSIDRDPLKYELMGVLKTVFCFDEDIIRVVLDNFLHIKQ